MATLNRTSIHAPCVVANRRSPLLNDNRGERRHSVHQPKLTIDRSGSKPASQCQNLLGLISEAIRSSLKFYACFICAICNAKPCHLRYEIPCVGRFAKRVSVNFAFVIGWFLGGLEDCFVR